MHPLSLPGETDLSVDVNFPVLKRAMTLPGGTKIANSSCCSRAFRTRRISAENGNFYTIGNAAKNRQRPNSTHKWLFSFSK